MPILPIVHEYNSVAVRTDGTSVNPTIATACSADPPEWHSFCTAACDQPARSSSDSNAPLMKLPAMSTALAVASNAPATAGVRP